jgi:hypothetical protein
MANISLNKATRTCKVNTGWADRIFSDRFQNSNLLMCPTWNSRDLAGRQVCADSFWTKREGCNSSLDRIDVENNLRPQYMEYITLDACGINGDMYGSPDSSVGVTEQAANGNMWKSAIRSSDMKENFVNDDAMAGCASLNQIPRYTGQFGQGNFRSEIEPTCPSYSYEMAMAEIAQANRQAAMMNHAGRYQDLRQYRYSL